MDQALDDGRIHRWAEQPLSYGVAAGGGSDIDMAARSLIQVMLELAGTVDVPKAHLEEKSAYPDLSCYHCGDMP